MGIRVVGKILLILEVLFLLQACGAKHGLMITNELEIKNSEKTNKIGILPIKDLTTGMYLTSMNHDELEKKGFIVEYAENIYDDSFDFLINCELMIKKVDGTNFIKGNRNASGIGKINGSVNWTGRKCDIFLKKNIPQNKLKNQKKSRLKKLLSKNL